MLERASTRENLYSGVREHQMITNAQTSLRIRAFVIHFMESIVSTIATCTCKI